MYTQAGFAKLFSKSVGTEFTIRSKEGDGSGTVDHHNSDGWNKVGRSEKAITHRYL